MTHDLNIDLETYSSVNLGKCGLYKYAQSPDFAVLLFGYSLDGGPVEVIDLMGGDKLPEWLAAALTDDRYRKHAYNAAFEWYCLSRYLGRELPVSQWRDTMLHGLYLGYPAGLAALGKVLGLAEDKRKMAAGKSLIQYFCVPDKAGNRRLPRDDPDKWALFTEYNRQDVVTEMEIERRLAPFPVPDFVQKQWETDLLINARGVALDRELIDGALWIDRQVKGRLTEEAQRLTGIANPGSRAQLLSWLQSELPEGQSPEDLKKDTVSQLLAAGVGNEKVSRVLELRQQLGKTSTSKYEAMERAMGEDGRARGLLQFYGANRTGRWAGRLIQVQNLPRTYLSPVPLARELVKGRKEEALRLLYGNVPDALSQLIRTALVPGPGKIFADADFSAIEARVVAWLAGEEWVLEVFRSHGKIYEATASQMFGVPIDRIRKGNPEYALRQKGKVATLALGFGGNAGALINMGALKMGLAEEELPEIVRRWREANPNICRYWKKVEGAALQTLRTGRPNAAGRVQFSLQGSADGQVFLTAALPSGRSLYYAHPGIGAGKFGEAVTYWGVQQSSRRWECLDTWGGKLTENIVQATARDILAEAVERLEAAGYPVVFHIHDEVVVEAEDLGDAESNGAQLRDIARIMGAPVSWAPGLPLKAEGWTDHYFKKD